ncbi:hypothetical protein [Streptomyces hygroscopicus]|uniref:hypothetical protein n=1 Tax=Streptomyces hygroscopicus TaxID=1912 RepID=UPI001FCB3E6B|nr:hypothetical protein [Streptomyces hygroscopicus]
MPGGITLAPGAARAYAANQGSNTVSVIDTAADAVTGTITVGGGPLAWSSPRTASMCTWRIPSRTR